MTEKDSGTAVQSRACDAGNEEKRKRSRSRSRAPEVPYTDIKFDLVRVAGFKAVGGTVGRRRGSWERRSKNCYYVCRRSAGKKGCLYTISTIFSNKKASYLMLSSKFTYMNVFGVPKAVERHKIEINEGSY